MAWNSSWQCCKLEGGIAAEGDGLLSEFLFICSSFAKATNVLFHSVLNVELFNMKFRQLHSEASTLIQSLRRSFAQKTSGHIDNTAIKMWEVLSSSVFDEVDEEKMVKIVRGEALIGGMKRMGY
jgi:hypothetical protein